MEWIDKLNIVLGIICLIIGVLLIPMGIWFLKIGLKSRDIASYVICGIIFALALASLVGAFNLFTSGLIQFSDYMQWLK